MVKCVLFDVDGVLVMPGEPFSVKYARSKGLDIKPFRDFFKNYFQEALVGRADLKDLIKQHNDIWHCDNVDDLLEQWFESENVQNAEALKAASQLRRNGTPCFLATNQEYHRGNYMKNVMFKDMFDGYFVSGDLGAKKPQREFFNKVISGIRETNPNIRPSDIVFFDDTPEYVEGARIAGIDARLFTDTKQIEELL